MLNNQQTICKSAQNSDVFCEAPEDPKGRMSSEVLGGGRDRDENGKRSVGTHCENELGLHELVHVMETRHCKVRHDQSVGACIS